MPNGWKNAARKPVKNAELWQRLDAANASHKVTWEWVKGHQDDDKEYDKLDDEAKLNVDMDTACKDERVHGAIHKPDPYPGSGAMLIIARARSAVVLPRSSAMPNSVTT